eukprot:PhM_4_TR16077/c0_g1_i1/m.94351/K01785/galM, GALM; aldose 1-epimerase
MFVSDSAWEGADRACRKIRFGHKDTFEVECSDFGATVTSVVFDGDEMTLGCDTPAQYEKCPSFGATVGRVGNRIANGVFTLDGVKHELNVNRAPNHLHGGLVGYHKVMWDSYEVIDTETEKGVVFTRVSPDGEEKYPGALNIRVTYSVATSQPSTLRMRFEAHSLDDKATPVNLINHNYWNLSGWQKMANGTATVKDHVLGLRCPFYLPVDANCLTTGEITSVKGTPFDFYTEPKKVADGIPQLNCLVVEGEAGVMRDVADVFEPTTKRRMVVRSTYPGVQLYTADFFQPGTVVQKGLTVGPYSGLCVECQYFSNNINWTHFPSSVNRRGVWQFDETATYSFAKE